jgi:hypothetical protein
MCKYILNICIPTYNRKTLIYNIESYLRCKDQRFCITIQDNCSTDGSYEALKQITDNRFELRRNASNIGGSPNSKCVLEDNFDSKYLLFILDKDFIDINRISEFIDFLEKESPTFGYLDLYNLKQDCVENYQPGIESIIKIGYLKRHPSGYFWQRALFENEIAKPYFKALPYKFDFWFDLLCSHFAVNNSGCIVYLPLVLHGPRNPHFIPNKTISYNENNLFFGCSKNIEILNHFINDLNDLDLPKKDKYDIALRLFISTMYAVSTALRNTYHNDRICFHYDLQRRTVSWWEMFCNSLKVLRAYNLLMKSSECFLSRLVKSILVLGYSVIRFSILCIKELFVKPRNVILTL